MQKYFGLNTMFWKFYHLIIFQNKKKGRLQFAITNHFVPFLKYTLAFSALHM